MDALTFAEVVTGDASPGVFCFLFFCLAAEDQNFLLDTYLHADDSELTADAIKLKRALEVVESRRRLGGL